MCAIENTWNCCYSSMKKLLGAAVFPTCTDCARWNVSTDQEPLWLLHRFIHFNHLNVLICWSCHLLAFFLSTLRCTSHLIPIFSRIFVKMSLDQTFLFSAATMWSFFFSDTFCSHKSWVFQSLSKSKLATILIDVTGSRRRYMQLRFRTPSVRNFFHKRQFSLPWQKIYKFPFN